MSTIGLPDPWSLKWIWMSAPFSCPTVTKGMSILSRVWSSPPTRLVPRTSPRLPIPGEDQLTPLALRLHGDTATDGRPSGNHVAAQAPRPDDDDQHDQGEHQPTCDDGAHGRGVVAEDPDQGRHQRAHAELHRAEQRGGRARGVAVAR